MRQTIGLCENFLGHQSYSEGTGGLLLLSNMGIIVEVDALPIETNRGLFNYVLSRPCLRND